MKVINLTVDNYFRNPFRWKRCHINVGEMLKFGVYISYGEIMPRFFIKRWIVVIYLGKKYRAFSNYEM